MSVELDALELEISSNSDKASKGIDGLIKTLGELKNASKSGSGLNTIARGLDKVNSAIDRLNVQKSKLSSLRTALSNLTFGQNDLTKTANRLTKLNEAIKTLNVDSNKFAALSSAMQSVSSVEKATGMNSVINTLKKLDTVTEQLEKTDLGKFATQMQKTADAVRPLSTEMQKVSNGFNAFPIKIQRLIAATDKVPSSTKKASIGLSGMMKGFLSFAAIDRAADKVSDWVVSSNAYVENMNLFSVTMGEAADSAFEYAEAVNKAVGIDVSEWMKYQGMFKQIASGFGVLETKANTMSKNLTQLGYDISSFYNISIEDAMQKLESGIAGEIEPMRRLGYAIDEATLKQVALAHGISLSVNSMTQGQKSQLRYIAIMEQSKNSMGDLARTVQTPANAMRIMHQQLNQLTRALGNLFIPIIEKVLPYLQVFTELLTDAVQRMAQLMGFTLPKIDYSGMQDGLSGVGDDADDTTNSLKKLKNAVLGIDELNVLDKQNTTSGSNDLGLDMPEYDFLAGLNQRTDELKKQIEAQVGVISAIMSGALLVLGAILAFSGVNIPLGIGLMAAGAIGLAAEAAIYWNAMDSKVATALAGVMAVCGASLFALGAVLVFSGTEIPLGIGMMVAGGTLLAGSAIVAWHSMDAYIQGAIASLLVILGGASLAIGAIMVFSGADIPLGIALMAAGLAAVGGGIAVAWGSVSQQVRAAVSAITLVLGGALLAVGALFAFSGANVPLGIGLMVAGAVSIGAAAALNWGMLTTNVSAALGAIALVASGAALALGVILALSGNIPIGIGLIAIGAAGIATALTANWSLIPAQVQSVLSSIMVCVAGYMLAIGAVLLFAGQIPVGLGLVAAGALILGKTVAANWGALSTKLRQQITAVTAIVSAAFIALGAIMLFTGANIPLGIGMIVAGIASGATAVAVNWGYLKAQVQSALASLTAIVAGASVAIGVALILMGQIPLGLMFLLGGAVAGMASSALSSKSSTQNYSRSLNSLTAANRSFVNTNTKLLNDYTSLSGSPDIGMFASGGFPAHGSLFVAGENGAEMVGQIGNRTAVVNNDQIVSGIASANDGVINAVMAIGSMIVKAIDDKDNSITLDGKIVSRALYKYNNEVAREKGTSLVTGVSR